MENQKKVIHFLLWMFLVVSCDNQPVTKIDLSIGNRKDLKLLLSNDSIVIFTGNCVLNKADYVIRSIHANSSNYELIQLLNAQDTISFYKDELYISDSIYDINNDHKVDLNITYQTTDGLVTYTYLFDYEKKRLKKKPLVLYNFVHISESSFYQITKNALVYTFKKYSWNGLDIRYVYNYTIDKSTDVPIYFKVLKDDSVKVNLSEIPNKDKNAILEYFSQNITIK